MLLYYYLTSAYRVVLATVRQCDHVTVKFKKLLCVRKYLSDQNFM